MTDFLCLLQVYEVLCVLLFGICDILQGIVMLYSYKLVGAWVSIAKANTISSSLHVGVI